MNIRNFYTKSADKFLTKNKETINPDKVRDLLIRSFQKISGMDINIDLKK
jgi:hypothetical protein